jgi:hypothetical protein
MWNDTDIPLAYLITFRSYGTWLHGDKRGSVDRFHNQYKSPYLPPDRERLKHTLSQLSREIVHLNAKQRESVEKAIRETCERRNGFCLLSTYGQTMFIWSFQLEFPNPNGH